MTFWQIPEVEPVSLLAHCNVAVNADVHSNCYNALRGRDNSFFRKRNAVTRLRYLLNLEEDAPMQASLQPYHSTINYGLKHLFLFLLRRVSYACVNTSGRRVLSIYSNRFLVTFHVIVCNSAQCRIGIGVPIHNAKERHWNETKYIGMLCILQ